MTSQPLIEITCDAAAWEGLDLDLEAMFTELAQTVGARLLPWVTSPWHVSVLLTNDEGIRPLNAQYRGKDKATNVLSFGVLEVPVTQDAWEALFLPGVPFLLGDAALAFETIVAEADREEKTLSQHLSHLFVHALLHLLGYDHETEDEAHAMESLEVEILASARIPNPYILDHICDNESEQVNP
ncbi:MAG: rRNA maturation RNase YbeY [Proteobacteria bacterium]|nr:rRNA maturation RNase YbeY [Pseudomonadota bacterium]